MAGSRALEIGNILLCQKVRWCSNTDGTYQTDIKAALKGFYNQIRDNFTINTNHESNKFNTSNKIESTSPN